MNTSWDPSQYLKFGDERERPFWELVRRVPLGSPRLVVDLGCGPGTATAGLLERWPGATVVGLDNSEEMIARASVLAVEPRLSFRLDDVSAWQPAPGEVDVLISNAALHWVPGHMDCFARWLDALSDGGVLAFQVPGNFEAPSHALLAELAASARWRPKLARVAELVEPHTPAEYGERLVGLSADLDVWETTYYHRLNGPDPVLEWVRGSALRPYLDALGPKESPEFVSSYAEALRKAYPPGRGGTVTYPFRRVFVVAVRS